MPPKSCGSFASAKGCRCCKWLVFFGKTFSCLLTRDRAVTRICTLAWVEFPSGQRDQTVNLTAQPSKVRILLPPPFMRGCSLVVELQPSKLIVRVRFPPPAPDRFRHKYAHIAQSVEHFLGKEEVTGSNPVMSSIFLTGSRFVRLPFCFVIPGNFPLGSSYDGKGKI